LVKNLLKNIIYHSRCLLIAKDRLLKCTGYGRKRNLDHLSEEQREILLQSDFPYLHAKKLTFLQPTSGQPISVEASRPQIFEKLLSALKGK
jgi:hypothetical protein